MFVLMIPEALEAIERDTFELGFSMPSERQTGALLRTLVAMKPGGRFLELGTGTGLATAWLLDGMAQEGRLDSVDSDPAVLAIARRHLSDDSRATFHECDGEQFITNASPETYDLIFADAWPGKYSHLDSALGLVKIGGTYLIDDMNPQPNWPNGHAVQAERLIGELEMRADLVVCRLDWSTGVLICTRTV